MKKLLVWTDKYIYIIIIIIIIIIRAAVI